MHLMGQKQQNRFHSARRLLAVGLLFSLLCAACAPSAAPAPTPEPTAAAVQETPAASPVGALWRQMDATAPFSVDLDGDGAEETVSIYVDENAYRTAVSIERGGQVYADVIDAALYALSCHVGDADEGDGLMELYVSGDAASDDYITVIYRCLPNGSVQRSEQLEGEAIDACGDGLVRFSTVVNVLGTYSATCSYRLENDLQLTLETPYTVVPYDDAFETSVLTLVKDGLPAMRVSVGEAALHYLDAGMRLRLAETDQKSYAVLEAESGERYRVDLARDPATDWGWLVEGEPEADWFGMLPYAG